MLIFRYFLHLNRMAKAAVAFQHFPFDSDYRSFFFHSGNSSSISHVAQSWRFLVVLLLIVQGTARDFELLLDDIN